MRGSPKITSQEIDNYFDKVTAHYKIKANYDASVERASRMAEREKEFLDKHPICTPAVEINLIRQGRDVDFERIEHFVEHYRSQTAPQEVAACAVQSALYFLSDDGKIIPGKNIHSRITDLRRIGTESKYGIILRGAIDGTEGLFVFKSSQSQTEEAQRELLHELVVGMYLNKLREKCPNFAYTYGSFTCSPPILDEDDKVIDWCSEKSTAKSTYVIYEDLGRPEPSYVYARRGFKQLVSLLAQVTFSLKVANESYKYTHYDLHTGNVQVTSADQQGMTELFQIPYTSKSGKKYYVTSDATASIIDNGNSYIDIFGAPRPIPEHYRMYNDTAFPIHDIFKFVCGLYETIARTQDTKSKNFLTKLIGFFTNENVTKFLQANAKHNYSLPLTKITQEMTLDKWLAFFLSQPEMQDIVSDKRDRKYALLDYEEKWKFRDIFYRVSKSSTSPFVFEDLYYYHLLGEETEPIDQREATADAREKVERLITTFKSTRSNLDIVELKRDNVLDKKTLTEVKLYVNNIFRFFSLVEDAETLQHVIDWVIEEHKYPLSDLSKKLEILINSVTSSICLHLPVISRNTELISNVIGSSAYKATLKTDKDFVWYENILPSLILLGERLVCPGFEDTDVVMDNNNGKKRKRKSSIFSTTTGSLFERKNRKVSTEQ